MKNIFEQATKTKLRFNSTQGLLTTEDLWDLPLTSQRKSNLNDIAVSVSDELDKSTGKSFVKKVSEINTELELKLEILKYIISVKIKEIEDKENEKIRADKKAKLESLLEKKQDESLESLSVDEIKAQLDNL